MLNDIETDRENASWRTSETGPGAELVRKWVLERLHQRLAAFYAHASLADLLALEATLGLREGVQASPGSATLVEAFLKLFGFQADQNP